MTLRFASWPPPIADAGTRAWLEWLTSGVAELRGSVDALAAAVNRDNASIRDGLEMIERDFGRLANAMDPRAATEPNEALAAAALGPRNTPPVYPEFSIGSVGKPPC